MCSASKEMIQNLGVLSEIVYHQTKYPINNPVVDDSNMLTTTYTVIDTIDINGLQAMLVKDAGDNYTFVFRGTSELSDWTNSDIPMALDIMPEQMLTAVSFIINNIEKNSLNASNTIFTGHSLGGSLASMASYLFGFNAYSFNGFGIENLLNNPEVITFETILQSHGIEPSSNIDGTTTFIHEGIYSNYLISDIGTTLTLSGHIGTVVSFPCRLTVLN